MIKRRLHCLDCGHETDLEPTFPNGKLKQAKAAESTKTNSSTVPLDAPAADRADTTQAKAAESTKTNLSTVSTDTLQTKNFLSQNGQLVDVVIKPVTPPNADKLVEIDSEADTNEVEEAAALLLAVAGNDQKHIEMSRAGEKKYYQVNRPLQLSDLVEHLKGGQARGALCSYQDGRTRALCFDADDPETWEKLKQEARQLAQAGYNTILEESPAERGGHLWIIYTDKVNAAAARAAVCELAPELEEITEYWPAPANAHTWNRVRLPGAFYARYGCYVEQPVKAWCNLLNAATGKTASNGMRAATLLLASLTPAALVPALPVIRDQAEQKPEHQTQEIASQSDDQAREVVQQREPEAQTRAAGRAAPLPNTDQAEQGYRLPEVDARWIKDNGPVETTTLYFAITARYAARWFNEHHSLEEIRSRERNGLALSPNGNERTASTSYRETEEGERYTDHSQHGRRSDGTRDTGDALELTAKVQGVSKGQLISRTTKQITAQASAELESAARAGESIPAWMEEIITPAGRHQYAYWLNERNHGQRGNRNQLGAGSRDVSGSTGRSISVSKGARRDDGGTEAKNSPTGGVQAIPGRDALEPAAGDVRHGLEKLCGGVGENCRGTEGHDRATQSYNSDTAETFEEAERAIAALQPEQEAQKTPAEAPAMRRIGTCLTVSYRTGKPCGSTHWYPSPDEEYVCVRCLSPLAWTRRIEAEQRKQQGER